MMNSQSSTTSTTSTIPPELVENQDGDFLDEINEVNNLFFGNVELPSGDYLGRGADVDNDSDSSRSSSDENDDNDDNLAIHQELSNFDKNEYDAVNSFKIKTCGCVRLYGHACSTEIDWGSLIEYRNNIMEMSKEELDMMVKVQLYHHRRNDSLTTGKKHKSKERERTRQEYFLCGKQVCRDTFVFAHGVNRKKIDSIAKSLDQEGLGPRTHGNKGKLPKHALTLTDVQNIKQFLVQYALKFGLSLPGRLPNYRDHRVVLLPSDKTKLDIHQEYLTSADSLGMRKVCGSEFLKIWLEQCPNIVIIKPATDLCYKCQNFARVLQHSGNMPEEEKRSTVEEYKAHLDKSTMQRDDHRQQCEESKKAFSELPEEKKQRGQPQCSSQVTQHYSFDYAQQVHYPHYSQQVGPLFFKTPRKCQCFGVCAEGSSSQIFYLVDEAEHAGKGANAVTSMLHHHFTYKSYGETDVKLHMDNCSGQNKNNTVIGYGLWRVMTSKHHSVLFSLMEAGHTKFNPDWHFGLWKVKWRMSTAETLAEVAETVKKSSRNNHNIPQLVADSEFPVVFYDWSSYLKKYFKPLPYIKSYHHFRMNKDNPGIVFVKKYVNSEEHAINILKNRAVDIINEEMPQEIISKGLDPLRQWYLYDEVSPYCDNKQSCPRPAVPKPVNVHKKEKTCKKQKSEK